MQNIPSHNKEIRLMFTAGYTDYEIETSTDRFEINEDDEIETNEGWISASQLKINNIYRLDTNIIRIVDLIRNNHIITVVYQEEGD